MIDVPFALALTAGMVATVNPCGFAMLPAYLSFFLGVESEGAGRQDRGARVSIGRGLLVGVAVTSGFAVTFGLIGLVVYHLTSTVYDVGPWITVVIGIALVGFGIALLAGFEPSVRLPTLDRGGRTRGLLSMAVFGVSYAVASLGCTLPLFLALASGTFRSTNVVSGVLWFLTYALGMGLVLTALTLGLALAKHSLVRSLRRVLPYVQRIAGGLLVVAGAYVAYYGVYEIRFGSDALRRDGVVDRVTGWSSDISDWVQDTGGTRIALLLGAAVTTAVLYVVTRRTATRSRPRLRG